MKLNWQLIILTWILCVIPSMALGQVKVVATLPTLGALAREVGGSDITVEVLARPGEDPHFVDPRPDFVLKLSRADLLIHNGMELEIGWLPALQKNARNARVQANGEGVLDTSTFIQPLEVPMGKVDRSDGDVHAQGNPHYLYSLDNAIAVADGIAQKLSSIDPSHAENYRQRLATFKRAASETGQKWKSKFAALDARGRRIVGYHASLVYLCTWLGLEQVATVEPKPGVSPSPSHVAKLVAQLKTSPVGAVVQETYHPRGTSEKIAQMSGAKWVIFSPGPQDDEPYLEYIDKMMTKFF